MTSPDATPGTESARCCGGATDWIALGDATALASRLAAVADPTRVQVLSIIANAPDEEVCACDFVEPLAKSQPTISHHLKVLTDAGLVTGTRRGRWIWYRLTTGGLDTLAVSLRAATTATTTTRT
ncbi:MAG: ArsR/SmtB family transcription factor [Ilumatobacter sp.]